MAKIHLLDTSLINKIAAGEVIERPASVVKELIENSIDAGATSITIEIKSGGINYIRITDNGCGIPPDEVKTAFLRHATSKLECFDDLMSILTLGFRGEALSSIASVAQVELITRTKEEESAVKIEISGGKILNEERTASNIGTTIVVKNLFYNTPARRKFLKKPASESGHISDIVNKIALGQPHISIKLINNGSQVLHTSGNNDIKTAVFHIYGKEAAKKMLPVEISKNNFILRGMTGRPELSRGNRSYENFFINGRYIRSSIVQKAAEDAYQGRLMGGKFPVFVIDLTVPANTVDVNVHPSKLEVRFSDEDFIYELVKNGINNALKDENLIPSVELDKSVFNENTSSEEYVTEEIKTLEELLLVEEETDNSEEKEILAVREDTSLQDIDIKDYDLHLNAKNKSTKNDNSGDKILSKKTDFELGENDDEKIIDDIIIEEEIAKNKTDKTNNIKKISKKNTLFNNYKIIGQIFNTYWIVEQNGSMYMIDQHAAHEKVLYEELMDMVKSQSVISQRLLQSVAVNLSIKEMQTVKENIKLFENFGFELEQFGENTYAIRAVPFIFKSPVTPNFFVDILDILADNKYIESIYETKLDLMASMSCKAAVKGNNRLSFVEAKALIDKVLCLDNPFSCPHGRPTIIEIDKYEIDKKFKRIQN